MKVPLHFKLDPDGRVCIVYIRKNACSNFKFAIIDSLGPEAKGLPAMRAMGRFRYCTRADIDAASIRAFILRDPFERIVSGWLNQVVQAIGAPYPLMFEGIEAATSKAIGDVTFADLTAHYLGQDGINAHFMPVTAHLLPIVYTHVLHDKTLQSDARMVFGADVADRYFFRLRNATASDPTYSDEDVSQWPASEIHHQFARTGRLPTKESFLIPPVRQRLASIYEADLRLYRHYLENRSDAPISIDAARFV